MKILKKIMNEGSNKGHLDSNWGKIKYLYYVAIYGSLTSASFEVDLTQSCLSRHIMSLETSLGVTLFERTVHGLIIKPIGEALMKPVTKIFLLIQEIEKKVEEIKKKNFSKIEESIKY